MVAFPDLPARKPTTFLRLCLALLRKEPVDAEEKFDEPKPDGVWLLRKAADVLSGQEVQGVQWVNLRLIATKFDLKNPTDLNPTCNGKTLRRNESRRVLDDCLRKREEVTTSIGEPPATVIIS